jgi:hypothetical protein
MQIHNSQVRVGSSVTFPEWKGERHYMIPFTVGRGLVGDLGRYQTTVNQMMEGILVDTQQECYLMVDEKEVVPGNFHRRPGLHVDGYWHPAIQKHGGGHVGSVHGGHLYCHGDQPYWSPKSNHEPKPEHDGYNKVPEGLLLASSYSAARAVVGQYNRDFIQDWRGGDCSELSTQGMKEVKLQSGRAYHMDVMTLHESLPITEHVRRTLVRINVPNWQN